MKEPCDIEQPERMAGYLQPDTVAAFETALAMMRSDLDAERAEHEHALWGQQQVIDELRKRVAELEAEIARRDRIEEEREQIARTKAPCELVRTL